MGGELWTVRTDRSGRYQIHGVVDPGHCSDLHFTIRHPDRRATDRLPVECGEQRLDFDFPSPHQGPNRILAWDSAWNEYLIPRAYDGYSGTRVPHCPFCGAKLPESRVNEWYDRLYALGFDDPGEQDIPEEFKSDKWWRRD